MKAFEIKIILIICLALNKLSETKTLGVKLNEICSLPSDENECNKFYNLDCSQVKCDYKYSIECLHSYCATTRQDCMNLIEMSIFMRTINRPKMFKSRNRNYDKFIKNIRRCHYYDNLKSKNKIN